MSERKVLGKYYPPDFDPSALVRKRGPKQTGPKIQPVRLMAPFSMKCTTCGEFIYKGRKFNARKETPPDFVYLGVQRFRFYIKCTRCSAEVRNASTPARPCGWTSPSPVCTCERDEQGHTNNKSRGQIIFATDPASQDYVMVRGATRNQEVWRAKTAGDAAGETDEQRLDRLEREEAEAAEEQERNAMQELEAETVDAKREMAVADALDEIRTRNARIERAVGADGLDALVGRGPGDDADDERARQEREDEEAARKAFAFARAQQALEEPMDVNEDDGDANGAESSGSSSSSALAPAPAAVKPTPAAAVPAKDPAAPSFKRQVKKKKDHGALLGIKKKPALV